MIESNQFSLHVCNRKMLGLILYLALSKQPNLVLHVNEVVINLCFSFITLSGLLSVQRKNRERKRETCVCVLCVYSSMKKH